MIVEFFSPAKSEPIDAIAFREGPFAGSGQFGTRMMSICALAGVATSRRRYETMSPSEICAAELRVLEERLAMPAATESRETLAQLLTSDFTEFGSSGRIYDFDTTLEALIPTGRPGVKFEDFVVRSVSADAMLVTYVSRSLPGPGWKPPALRSSLWVRREHRWQMLFHQGTRLAEDDA
jgi:hypothetical protein